MTLLPDDDRDGLSNDREATLGTNPNVKDTCGIASHCVEYNDYANYADEELFCRVKQDGILGDASKDWSLNGVQSPGNR